MKKITIVFLISVLTIVSYNDVNAQPGGRSYNTMSDVAMVNDVSVALESLYVLDSLKGIHTAIFEIRLGSDEAKRAWGYFLSAAMANQPVKLALFKLNQSGQAIEERSFKFFAVNEITVSDFSGSSKEIPKLRVKVQSQDADIRTDNIEMKGVSQSQDKGDKRVNSSTYKLVIGNLPNQRITAINNIRFNSQGTGGYLYFNIEVVRADAKAWKDWFYGGSGKKEQGSLQLFDLTMANMIMSFQLSEVEIISVSESSGANSDAQARTTIGLRARRFELTK